MIFFKDVWNRLHGLKEVGKRGGKSYTYEHFDIFCITYILKESWIVLLKATQLAAKNVLVILSSIIFLISAAVMLKNWRKNPNEDKIDQSEVEFTDIC